MRVAGKDQPDLALRAGQLGEALQVALLPDAAGEGGIGDIVEQARRLGAELDHPAAIVAVGDRPAAERRVGLEQRALARDLGAHGPPRARPRSASTKALAPVAQPLAVVLGGDLRASRAYRLRDDQLPADGSELGAGRHAASSKRQRAGCADRIAARAYAAVQPPSMLRLAPVIDAGLVAAQEQRERGDFLGRDEALGRLGGEQHVVHHLLAGQAARLHRVGDLVLDQRRPDIAGRDAIDGDAVARRLQRDRLGEAGDAVLGGDIGGLVGPGDEAVGATRC